MSEVEWKRGYYDSGQLHYEIPYINHKRSGIRKSYHDNGHLRCEFPYVNDHLHGIARWYHNNGWLDKETLWINGEERNDLLGDEHRLARLILLGEEQWKS